MARLDLTPWVRARLTDDDRAQIAVLAPEGSTVRIGYSTGYTCRILDASKVVIGEAFRATTPMSAFLRALDNAKEAAA